MRRRSQRTARLPSRLEGRVRDIARGGDAVIETSAGLVLAPGALPGERVTLTRLHRAAGVLRGEVERILERSETRVEPPCAIAHACGGCPLMSMSLEAQRALKRRFVEDAVRRAQARADLVVDLVTEGDDLAYRRRARMHWSRSALGFAERRSRGVVDVPRCIVLHPALDRALVLVRELVLPHLRETGEVRIGIGSKGAATVVLVSESSQPETAYRSAERMASQPEIAGVSLRAGGATSNARWGDPREQLEGADGIPLVTPVGGFSQGNDAVNRLLVEHVTSLAAAEDAEVLELYAGHGNFTVSLARGARSIVAVEQDAEAVQACKENLVARGLSATVRQGDAATHATGPRVDVVVLDPPRTGAREAVAGILTRKPRRIVYVSCDTATLARDLAAFSKEGYVVDAARAFDMFPHTAHVESAIRLVKDLC